MPGSSRERRRRAPLSVGPRWGTCKGACLPRTLKDGRKRSLKTERLFLLDLENWSVGCFTRNSDSYAKRVQENFGNPSLYRGCVRRTWGLVSCGLREKCIGRLWKRFSSFTGLHTGNRNHLARVGSAIMLFGPETVLRVLFCFV